MGELQAVFIDRDGTLGGTGHFIHPRDFTLYPRALEAIALLKGSGLRIFAFTNQHRIARGEAAIEEFEEQFRTYGFDQAYICPHSSDAGCACRKPGIGMLLQAAAEHGLDLARCAVIGDVGDTDMIAAHRAGALKILVRTGWGEGSLTEFKHRWPDIEPDYIAADIWEAAKYLIHR
ncbi:HAD-IIIA family hydrolase [Paenibacillus dendritiformis]|uniref:HAD-IIIA family hydrolase n=1 Tax=Paenibacillus dendritiformis TaxID=130049 RepID=UPI00248B9D24|nr:HAD-IIIA family hydrolase [Paenibacillus dendritiformis]WGU95898.1 HAD-IIIA family hydrolase [Paenibacillus dendritiformis]